MKKKFQIGQGRNGIRVIVRVEDDAGEKVSRKYQNLTWATMQRIDQLTYKDKYKVSTVTTPRTLDAFIQERSNG